MWLLVNVRPDTQLPLLEEWPFYHMIVHMWQTCLMWDIYSRFMNPAWHDLFWHHKHCKNKPFPENLSIWLNLWSLQTVNYCISTCKLLNYSFVSNMYANFEYRIHFFIKLHCLEAKYFSNGYHFQVARKYRIICSIIWEK
jgi:hypothetical protein